MCFGSVLNSDIALPYPFLHYQYVPKHCKSQFKPTKGGDVELIDNLKRHFQVLEGCPSPAEIYK